MSERTIGLGKQRLSVSQELGNDFASALEGTKVIESQEELVRDVQRHVSKNPGTQIVGTRLSEESTLREVEASLSRQMGLPPGSGLGPIKDRLAGREGDFLFVFPPFCFPRR